MAGVQLKFNDGSVLLSHTLASAVPSALAGLASRFGMETGRYPVAMTTVKMVGIFSKTAISLGRDCQSGSREL